MRNKTRRSTASQSPKKLLQLTRETVRTLTSEQLSKVVFGGGDLTCPTGSSDTQTKITVNH
jgi:hypothetical protein